jgi:hypothetical protein
MMTNELIERLIEEIAPACVDCRTHIVEARRSAMKRFSGRYREETLAENERLRFALAECVDQLWLLSKEPDEDYFVKLGKAALKGEKT